jgi:hypothetical protein
MAQDPDRDLHKFAEADANEAAMLSSLAEQETLRQAGDPTRLALDLRLIEIQTQGIEPKFTAQSVVANPSQPNPFAIAAE